jgi:hypothetical protein
MHTGKHLEGKFALETKVPETVENIPKTVAISGKNTPARTSRGLYACCLSSSRSIAI